ncbi:MAG: tetratricopeptide repeat protein [Candidatus Angelobacter sp.]
MKRFATFIAITLTCSLGSRGTSAQQASELSAVQIAVQSQEALSLHDEHKALTLIKEGLVRFPNDENLKIQLARVYVEQKHDRQAIGLLNGLLLANPSSRNAKLQLAQIFGYRENYREADRLYRELLAADPDDEAASLGLVHNLILEGNKNEARQQLQQAFARHPSSLELQQYSDYLAENPGMETPLRTVHRIQNTESFFADTSGNRSVYSGQGLVYQLNKNVTGRFRMEETSLWKTGTFTESVLSGAAEGRVRLNKYVAIRSSVGAVRFVDTNSRLLYGGDLEFFPWKHLALSGGFSRYPIIPTFDSLQFNLLAEGWHSRVNYSSRNFSVDGTFSVTHYSDGNHAEREWAETLRWFDFHDNRYAVGGGYAFRHIHFTKDLNHGYFSPGQYRSHLGAAGFRLRLGKHYRGEYLGYGGVEALENFADYSPAGELLLKNDFYFGRWDLAADYSYYHLIQTTGAFRANAVSVILGYKF